MKESSKGRIGHFVRYHMPMALYATAIIAVSSVPYLQTPKIKMVAFDKLAHFVEYALFSALIYRSFFNWRKELPRRRAFSFCCLFIICFALVDELYQSLIPGRFSEMLDYGVDITGAFLILTYLYWANAKSAPTPGPE